MLTDKNLELFNYLCERGDHFYPEDGTPFLLASPAFAYYRVAVTLCQSIKFQVDWVDEANVPVKVLRALGVLYQNGVEVAQDLVKAKRYYEKASQLGDYESIKALLILAHPQFTETEWMDLGQDFYSGGENKEKDYVKARACYELANAEPHALYMLGWLYEHRHGVEEDISKAKEYYEKALLQQYDPAIKQLVLLENPDPITENGWNALGARFNREGAYSKARMCYKETLELSPYDENALYNLGYLYEHGVGGAKDLEQAAIYYDRLMELKLEKYKKTLIRFEIKRTEQALDNAKITDLTDLNVQGFRQYTALHRAAILGSPKLYARLLALGADPEIVDERGCVPAEYLNDKARVAVNKVGKRLSDLHSNLNKSVTDTLFNNIVLKKGGHLKPDVRTAFETLYKLPYIAPLFDLAKLAIYGQHRLGGLPHADLTIDDYDSDTEEDIGIDSCFRMIVDPHKEDVDGVICTGVDGLEGKDSYGMYSSSKDTRNAIYIGGARAAHLIMATVLHELCHFLAHEVYNHKGLPFAAGDAINQARFSAIAAQLEAKKSTLPDVLKNAFSSFYQAENQIHAELIARVPQLIAEEAQGLHLLETQAPELWAYYQDTFLKDLRAYTEKLELRAYGHWRPTFFKEMVVDEDVDAEEERTQLQV